MQNSAMESPLAKYKPQGPASGEGAEPRKIRLSLDLSPEMKEIIDDLAAKSGTSQAEILRRSIALLKAIKMGEAQGESVAMVKDNKVVARLVGF